MFTSTRMYKKPVAFLQSFCTLQSPIHYSNVALIDPVTKAPVRISRRYLEDGTKVPNGGYMVHACFLCKNLSDSLSTYSPGEGYERQACVAVSDSPARNLGKAQDAPPIER